MGLSRAPQGPYEIEINARAKKTTFRAGDFFYIGDLDKVDAAMGGKPDNTQEGLYDAFKNCWNAGILSPVDPADIPSNVGSDGEVEHGG